VYILSLHCSSKQQAMKSDSSQYTRCRASVTATDWWRVMIWLDVDDRPPNHRVCRSAAQRSAVSIALSISQSVSWSSQRHDRGGHLLDARAGDDTSTPARTSETTAPWNDRQRLNDVGQALTHSGKNMDTAVAAATTWGSATVAEYEGTESVASV